jgi:polyhydroxyalkanoate synthase
MARSALRRATAPAADRAAEPAPKDDPQSVSRRVKSRRKGEAAAEGKTPADASAEAAAGKSAARKTPAAKPADAGTSGGKASDKKAAPKTSNFESSTSKTSARKTSTPKASAPKASTPKTAARAKPAAEEKPAPAKTAKRRAPAKPAAPKPAATEEPKRAGRSAKARSAPKRRKTPDTLTEEGPKSVREAAAKAREAAEPRDDEPKAGARPEDAAAEANPFLTPEVERFAANVARIMEEGGKALSAYAQPRGDGAGRAEQVVDIVRTIGQVAERWMADPAKVAEAQRSFADGFLELWSSSLKRFSGEAAKPVVEPDPKDGRFKDPEWTTHPFFDFLKQAYLHGSRWADRMVAEADELDPQTRQKAAFYVKLLSNAVSPSNFVPTNPELIRETLSSQGENLVRGMKMLAEDIAAGKGELRIRQTDRSGFEVGKNLATTPGKVVFRNELFELIQYSPSTEKVRARPVLIIPPWINKFYILDLTPEKSMIKWCVDQGLTVFCVSWVNPDERHANKSFDHYMRDGIMTAVDVAREITGSPQVDAVGYCVGGTLLAVTLAYMAAKGDERIASATFLTAQVDFTHAGDLKVFADEQQIAAVEQRMAELGYLEGGRMADAFNMIRSNDLIWPYVVNNYLKGKTPFPFDLLYWNSDATRMPAANHSFYLRGCYLNNDLSQGRMEICGEVLDLKKIKVPTYNIATREDHIAPARSVFLGTQLFGGPARFVLAGSGHIAGVVNHPARMKYQHWIGEDPQGELEDWIKAAEEKPGSWWPDWRAWLAAMDATAVPARIPGDGKYPALEDAPGSYVKAEA